MGDYVAKWLEWAREIQALAQTGLHYAQNEFEAEREERLLEIAAEIVCEHTGLNKPDVLQMFSSQPGYVTPKVDVRGVVFEAGEILMVREAMDGKWTLPGGWADVGETPSRAVEREVFEEAGLTVKARKLIGVYDANRVEDAMPLFHAYKLIFLCERQSGMLRESKETSEVAFFPTGELPEPLSPYRTTPRHIRDAIDFCLNDSDEVVFD
jgi:ADP-ribose pyrophosphatase YjhB (NUDIX family)